MYVATALVLGSLWALALTERPRGAAAWRTALEDRTLRRELPGYAEYAGAHALPAAARALVKLYPQPGALRQGHETVAPHHRRRCHDREAIQIRSLRRIVQQFDIRRLPARSDQMQMRHGPQLAAPMVGDDPLAEDFRQHGDLADVGDPFEHHTFRLQDVVDVLRASWP